jgi:hypothetical protein
MRLIGLVVVRAVRLILAPLAAGAPQTEKVRRIGFLSGTNPEFRGRRRPLSADSQVHPAIVRHQSRSGHQRVGGPVPEVPCKLKGLSHT